MAHDVFLSHSSKDRDAAEKVLNALEGAGVKCWIAPRDIRPGVSWPAAIVKAIGQSKVLILVFSADADASEQIKREVAQAVQHGLPLLPVRIQNVQPSADLAYFLVTPHWLDAHRPPLEDHLAHLVRTVQGLLNGGLAEQPGVAAARPVLEAANRRSARGVLVGGAAILVIGGGMAAWQLTHPPESTGLVAVAPTAATAPASAPAISPSPSEIPALIAPGPATLPARPTPAVVPSPIASAGPIQVLPAPGVGTVDPTPIRKPDPAVPTPLPAVVSATPPKAPAPFELRASSKVARLGPSSAAPLAVGELVSARLNDSGRPGDAHFWSVEVPAGEYRIVLEVKPVIDKPDKPGVELQWEPAGEKVPPLEVKAESGSRFVAMFSATGPTKRVVGFQNTGPKVDYWLCVAPKDEKLPSPLRDGVGGSK